MRCRHCHRNIVLRVGVGWIDPRPPVGCEEWETVCSEIGGDHEPRWIDTQEGDR